MEPTAIAIAGATVGGALVGGGIAFGAVAWREWRKEKKIREGFVRLLICDINSL